MAEEHLPMSLDPAPRRPLEPDASDCCGEGCVRCVYDIHDDAVERYQLALAAWQARHPGLDPAPTGDETRES
ncbi:MAG: oxidoreductase-like domain-containing protein [Rhodanobacter sp.]